MLNQNQTIMKTKWMLLIGIAVLFSCKKESIDLSNGDAVIASTDYFPLKVGNYWVYENYQINDLTGEETKLAQTDSIIITREKGINGKVYFVLEGTSYPLYSPERTVLDMIRDSAGYLVNKNGTVLFSANNFTDTLARKTESIEGQPIYNLAYVMENSSTDIRVPAGDFNALNFKGILVTPEKIQNAINPRYLNNYYAKDIGRILQTFYYVSNPLKFEKRLVRYHVQSE